ncbi:MAG: hypothetical protein WBM04_08245, partial [Candidatus Korobacteraceae bacterium]
ERTGNQAGYGKAGKQKPLSNFPTATTTTKYIQLWDTDSRGKATYAYMPSPLPRQIEWSLFARLSPSPAAFPV